MNIVAMAWQFATPVLYGLEMVPERLVPYFHLNPMTAIIVAYRDILYFGQPPQVSTLLSAIMFGIGTLIAGVFVFGKMKSVGLIEPYCIRVLFQHP